MNRLDFLRGLSVDLTALGEDTWITRHLSQMKNCYADQATVNAILMERDPIVYRYQSLSLPRDAGDFSFGISTVLPGTVGDEYYMTKGHFHEILMTAEVYYCLEGEGGLLIENQEGDARFLPMTPGKLVYVPKGYAHRTINTGTTPLSSLFVYRADAGHDYKTIETKGFRNIVVCEKGNARLRNNPLWS